MITGGCGFIGSHIAQELCNDNEILIVDNLTTGRKENIAEFRDRVELVVEDIRNADALCDLIKGADYVFHEAALVSVVDSVERPGDNHEINLTGTLNVMSAAAKAGVKRAVIASSAAVYGNDPLLPKTETMRPAPESPYGLAKITGEYYARVFSQLYSLPVVALRYFNVFGPRQDPGSPYSGVISIFVEKVLGGQTPGILGDGLQTRDFVFVKDVVAANLRAMHAPELKGGEVFNVGTGCGTSLLELLEAINKAAGGGLKPDFGPERAGDIKHSVACIDEARNRLGYAPGYSLGEGLRLLVDWRREQAS